MDISGTGAGTAALPRPVKVSGALIRLGIAALCAFAAVGGGYKLTRLLFERTEPSSLFAIFGGWQLDVMAVTLGAALVAFLVVSVIALVRAYRNLSGRSPHGRAVVMAAVLPGFFLGILFGSPMRSAISWASDHTAAAKHAEVEFRSLLPTNPKVPPVVPTGLGPAPRAVAERLLSPADIGPDWYSGQSPIVAGTARAAVTEIAQQHWTGTVWSQGNLLLENLRHLSSAEAAKRDLANHVPGTPIQVLVGTVRVEEQTSKITGIQRLDADFAVGADVFTLSVIGPSSEPYYKAVVTAAVRRATAR